MIGQNIGKYRVLDRVGRGGMGTVYRAVDETLHREVAIKVLNAELNDPEVAKRFRAEAITVARLSHPGIATIYELFQHDAQWLMVMEFVRGETLERLIDRSGSQSAERAASLCMQSLAALAHAHSMGVVHRDLKPANIMLTESGDIKIMDFGIARVTGTEHLTNVGFMMGTPAYMAPEQVLGQEIDARSDIYAMGVVLYRLLTAQLPFKGDTPFAMAQAQVNSPPIPLSSVRQDLPAWVEETVSRALAKKPEERFPSAVEFHDLLARSLSGDPALETYVSSAPTGLMTPPRAMPSGAFEMTALSPTPSEGSGAISSAIPYDAGSMAQTVATATPVTLPRPAVGAPAADVTAAAAPAAHTAAAAASVPAVPPASAATKPSAPAAAKSPAPAAGAARPSGSLPIGLIGAAVAVVAILAVGGWFLFGRTPAPAPQASAPAAATPDTTPAPAAVPTPAAVQPVTAAPSTPAPAPAAPPSTSAAPAATAAGTSGAASTPAPPAGRGATASTTAATTGRRGAAPAAPVDTAPPVSVTNVKVMIVDGREADDEDISLSFANGQISVVGGAGNAIAVMPYGRVTAATYVHARDPRWDPSLASPPNDLDVGGFLRSSRHWLMLQNADAFLLFRLEDVNVIQVLRELEARTGLTVRRPGNSN